MELTVNEAAHADVLLHDDFPREVEPDLYRYQGPGVVSPKHQWWTITDRRSGKAMYGHV